jgi:8-oxo-dGTP pyrophosphatase MutT (NUDIX family)
MGSLEEKYPHLFCKVFWEWGPIQAEFKLLDNEPPSNLIAHVNLVPRANNGWVLIQHKNGAWDIPGGTLEPGETYIETLRRELLEEAGAELLSFQVLGAWHCNSLAKKPYRPHLPFPEFYRLVGCGQVELNTVPSNPPDEEQIAAVECVSLKQTIANFQGCQRHDLVELYQFASEMENL